MPDLDLNIVLSVALGVGLAAATGFRVLLPLLLLSLWAQSGTLPVSDGFAWLGSTPALVMLAVAAVIEIAAYYIPGVDNLLDSLATPGAIVAGILASAAVMPDLPPMLRWALAIIAGGSAAGLTQGASVFLRAHSTAFTAGLGNSVLSTIEWVGALILSLAALLAPFLAILLLVLLALFTLRLVKRFRARTAPPPTA